MASQKDAFSYDSHDTVERLWYERPQQQGRSDLHGRIVHLHKTHSFPQLSLPYVCPEPVLVKRSFLVLKWRERCTVVRTSRSLSPPPPAAMAVAQSSAGAQSTFGSAGEPSGRAVP